MYRAKIFSNPLLVTFLLSQFLMVASFAQTNKADSSLAQFEDAQYFVKEAGKDKAKPVKGTLVFDPGAKSVRFESKEAQYEIPYNQITSLIYEKTAKPRYALGLLVAWPLLFTKSKGHYLTIQYKQTDGAGQFALTRLDKNNYQMALATAETQTGVKLQRIEEK
ncbi:MAG: hypothetical protein L0226_03715 [Acidobacteria bacterium]|nr:hypothetical protein [Acidobacteriota bacterium]